MKIDFFLPILPPSTNNLYAVKRNGQRYKKDTVLDFEKIAYLMLPKRPMMEEHCRAVIEFRCNDRRTWSRRDIDNMLKALLDSMQLVKMLKNDSLILEIRTKKILSTRESTSGYLESVDNKNYNELITSGKD